MDWKIYAVREYQNGRGTSDIAKELNKNSKLIREAIIKAGVPMRSHSEAQKLAIEKHGTPQVPKFTEEKKLEYSIRFQKYWNSDSEAIKKHKDNISKACKDRWENKDTMGQTHQVNRMVESSRSRVLVGSKHENEIARLLSTKFTIEKRSKSIIYPYEVDIYLPEIGVAIEVDGPTHFEPIYGDEHLKEVQNKDKIKDLAILQKCKLFIRCRLKKKKFTQSSCRLAFDLITQIIDNKQTGLQIIEI